MIVVVLVASGVVLPLVYLSSGTKLAEESPTESRAATIEVPAGAPPNCHSLPGGSIVEIAPRTGPPGSTISLAAKVPLFDENGRYRPWKPGETIQVWWNADPETWWDVLPGGPEPSPVTSSSVRHLASIDVTGKCFAEARLLVPQAPPATYNLVLIQVLEHSAGPALPPDETPRFTVTAG